MNDREDEAVESAEQCMKARGTVIRERGMTDTPKTPLAAPGAGLPPTERLLSGIGVKAFARLVPQATITRLLASELHKVLDLARSVNETEGRVRVLIERIPGIEDSSRDWSVFMTVEHLEIVNSEIAALLHLLCAERQTDRIVRIEEFKPNPEAGQEQIEALESALTHYTRSVADLGSLTAKARHAHPWFGPLSARQWHALAAVHNRLHRMQVERILRGLKAA